jgi:hypothetical protein
MADKPESLQKAHSIRAKAADVLKRRKGIQEFADKYGDDGALTLLALSADCDSNNLPELKAFIDEHPQLLKGISYLADDVLSTLIHKVKDGSGSAMVIRLEYEAMMEQLTLETDGPLEKMLITRVGLCWLRLQYAENYKTFLMRSDTTWKSIECADREIMRAHSRHVRAIESLARVRKLVKIAEMADTQSQILKARLNKPGEGEKPRLALASGQ